jgi:hypothetical protein
MLVLIDLSRVWHLCVVLCGVCVGQVRSSNYGYAKISVSIYFKELASSGADPAVTLAPETRSGLGAVADDSPDTRYRRRSAGDGGTQAAARHDDIHQFCAPLALQLAVPVRCTHEPP